MRNLTAKDLQSQIQKIQDFVKVVQKGEDYNHNPWSFISAINWSFSLDQQLESQLPDSRDKIKQLMLCIQNYFPDLAHKLNWEKCLSLATIADFTSLKTLPVQLSEPSEWEGFKQTTQKWLANVDELNQCQRELSQCWKQEIFNQDLKKLEKKSESLLSAFILMRWIGGFFFRRQVQQWYKGKIPGLKKLYKQICSLQSIVQLRQEVDDDRKSIEQHLTNWNGEAKQLTALVDEYQTIFSSLESFQDEDLSLDNLTQIQPEYWTALKQKIDAVKENFGILQNALEIEEFPPSSQRHPSFDALFQWLEDLTRSRKKLYAWSQYSQIKTEFINSSIGSILEWFESETVPLEELASTYKAVVLKVWFQECFDAEEILRNFNVDRHNITIQNFQKLEKDYLELSRRFVRAKVLSRVPNLDSSLKGSEAAELIREIAKKQRHLPVRIFFQKIPNLLPLLKPCLLMSPISVAQCLPADGRTFDLIIFDEASQIETHDAIGTIARGKQLIVVGDNKQMPPSNFFGGNGNTDNTKILSEDTVEDLESILDEAIACNLPQQMLQWHYRSRHESLILFSNQHYYNNKLNLFPAATQSHSNLGLKWHPTSNGFYQPGERVNKQEAHALVDYLFSQLRQYEPGERSFGIITFSSPQQLLIEKLIRKKLDKDNSLEKWFDEKLNLEYCFIKNLETVQGDERDEILFSICYAPQTNGKLSMNFGPLNRLGGERRLNVAITRARTALHVFSTLTAEDIDLNRTNALAVRHLKEFLALTAQLNQESGDSLSSTKSFDSELHRQVYTVLTEAGYEVDCQIGCAEYRIDFGIRHPNKKSQYILGVECDGTSYIAAATVRDRDCLRQAVLKNMGWQMYRVWSIDWLLDRDGSERRLLQAVEKVIKNLRQDEDNSPITTDTSKVSTATKNQLRQALVEFTEATPAKVSNIASISSSPLQDPAINMSLGQPYLMASLDLISESSQEFYDEASTPLIEKLLLKIVDVESPIKLSEAAQRLGQCWSFGRFTKRALKRVQDLVEVMVERGDVYFENEVLWKNLEQSQSWREFRTPPTEGRILEQIPKIEIMNAMKTIVLASLSITSEDLLRETLSKLTTTNRFTSSQREMLEPILSELLASSQLQQNGDRISR